MRLPVGHVPPHHCPSLHTPGSQKGLVRRHVWPGRCPHHLGAVPHAGRLRHSFRVTGPPVAGAAVRQPPGAPSEGPRRQRDVAVSALSRGTLPPARRCSGVAFGRWRQKRDGTGDGWAGAALPGEADRCVSRLVCKCTASAAVGLLCGIAWRGMTALVTRRPRIEDRLRSLVERREGLPRLYAKPEWPPRRGRGRWMWEEERGVGGEDGEDKGGRGEEEEMAKVRKCGGRGEERRRRGRRALCYGNC